MAIEFHIYKHSSWKFTL